MIKRPLVSFAAACALMALAGCSGDPAADEAAQAAEVDPLAALGIKTAAAEKTDGIPLGTVPGTVTLPPEARVAVTAPFPGAVVRVLVIEGQAVRQGQALAVIRAAEPVQIQGELSRSQAEFGLADERAKRMRQLAEEGIIAQARADEAQAQLRQAQASVAESRRLASLAGVGSDGTMTLAAPIAGRVQHVGVETGGPVDGMSAPFVIENAGAYRLDLQLPERLASTVKPGMAVEVLLPVEGGAPIAIGGSILSVTPSIDPLTRSVMAKAKIASAPGLVPGRNVMVTISGTGSATGVAVPSSAVTQIGGEDHVFVQSKKVFAPRKVTVAAEAAGRTVIAKGLEPGEVVATSSITELKAMSAE